MTACVIITADDAHRSTDVRKVRKGGSLHSPSIRVRGQRAGNGHFPLALAQLVVPDFPPTDLVPVCSLPPWHGLQDAIAPSIPPPPLPPPSSSPLQHCPSLVSLDLSSSAISDASLYLLSLHATSLTSLSLKACRKVRKETLEHLLQSCSIALACVMHSVRRCTPE